MGLIFLLTFRGVDGTETLLTLGTFRKAGLRGFSVESVGASVVRDFVTAGLLPSRTPRTELTQFDSWLPFRKRVRQAKGSTSWGHRRGDLATGTAPNDKPPR